MSMFSQRHYIAVADTIGLTMRQIDQDLDDEGGSSVFYGAIAIHKLIDNFEVTFKEDSSRFKTSLFNRRIGLVRREGLQS